MLLGAFQASPLAASVAVLGVILGAVYLLWAYQRMWQGRCATTGFRALPDLSGRDWAVLFLLLVAIVVLGMAPGLRWTASSRPPARSWSRRPAPPVPRRPYDWP